MNTKAELFWEAFVKTLPETCRNQKYTAWAFGNTPKMKDDLAELVLRGPKRATTSLKWIYAHFPELKMPEVGEYSVILNSLDEPVCIIKNTLVEERKFCEIDEAYAATEGEGDRSLKYWREVHWAFFAKECEMIGRTPTEEMPVVCEIFEVVYPVL